MFNADNMTYQAIYMLQRREDEDFQNVLVQRVKSILDPSERIKRSSTSEFLPSMADETSRQSSNDKTSGRTSPMDQSSGGSDLQRKQSQTFVFPSQTQSTRSLPLDQSSSGSDSQRRQSQPFVFPSQTHTPRTSPIDQSSGSDLPVFSSRTQSTSAILELSSMDISPSRGKSPCADSENGLDSPSRDKIPFADSSNGQDSPDTSRLNRSDSSITPTVSPGSTGSEVNGQSPEKKSPLTSKPSLSSTKTLILWLIKCVFYCWNCFSSSFHLVFVHFYSLSVYLFDIMHCSSTCIFNMSAKNDKMC